MKSGKSLQLLAMAYNLEEQGIPCLCFKCVKDDVPSSEIKSRALDKQRESVPITKETDILKVVTLMVNKLKDNEKDPLKWILIDECQFLTVDQVNQLAKIVDLLNINVKCWGLKTDFQTHLFIGSKRLLEIANSLEEAKYSCGCGEKAIFNARVSNNGVMIYKGPNVALYDGKDWKYVPMCRKCYIKLFEETREIEQEIKDAKSEDNNN